MKRAICLTLSGIHVCLLAVCTYIAAIEIETIIVTGLICSGTGIAAAVSALACKRLIIAAAGFLTPLIAMVLFILEAFYLHLGPQRAALPFCIVFIINQAIATLVILVQLNLMTAPPGVRARQITIRTLMVLTAGFSVFFAFARFLLQREHNWLMALALGLGGLTFVGLTGVLYSAIVNRGAAQTAA